MTSPRRVLAVSGSLRAASTNTAIVRTAVEVAPERVEVVVYDGHGGLPQFNPDDDTDPLPPLVSKWRQALHDADAVLFSIPEYAGDMPGSFKNLLDWSIGDDQPGSIADKPVAWINASPRGAADAHDSLRRVLGYASAVIVESACTHLATTGAMVGPDGLVTDPTVRQGIADILTVLTQSRLARSH